MNNPVDHLVPVLQNAKSLRTSDSSLPVLLLCLLHFPCRPLLAPSDQQRARGLSLWRPRVPGYRDEASPGIQLSTHASAGATTDPTARGFACCDLSAVFHTTCVESAIKTVNPVSACLQQKDEAEYVKRLQRALKEHGLYYSYSADITTRSA